MGFFDAIFGRKDVPITDLHRLREVLFEAVSQADARRLDQLCRANQAAILQHFPAWQTVPAPLRNDASAVHHYAQGLIGVAQHFAECFAMPELLERLMGGKESNPLGQWQDRLAEARHRMDQLQYAEARDLLTDTLIDVRGLSGSGVDTYLPITLGYLGEAYFQSGAAKKAVPHMKEALRLCEAKEDRDGILAYLGNLYEAHRYLGQADPAVGYANRLADCFEKQGNPSQARRYRKQACILRASEPLNRVVAVIDNARYELDELNDIEGKQIQLVFERNRITLRRATELAKQGDACESAGRHEEALTLVREAAQADRFDPHARYLEGFALLHLQRPSEAVGAYEAAEERAPGWFHCRCDLWLAHEMAAGTIDQATFLALHTLEDGAETPEEKVRLAERILARSPRLALGHLHQGRNLAKLGRPRDAEKAFREGVACAAEPDMRSRLLVELAIAVPDARERSALLSEAIDLPGNLVAAATAALALRAQRPNANLARLARLT